jgi:hypothetical protein
VNTTVFSVVNGFLLRPLPVPHPEQIAVLALKQASVGGTYSFSHPTYEDLREQADSFSDVLAYRVVLAGLSVDHNDAPHHACARQCKKASAESGLG